MRKQDLSALKIDRAPGASALGEKRIRRHRGILLGLAAAILIGMAAAGVYRVVANPTVQTTAISTVYPSQNYTLLQATGYVVAQRKAAISSKASGRLEWLGVLEGSRVKKDELVARLENRDVNAALEQAIANVGVAQAQLQQGLAELQDARNSFVRSRELLRQHFISPAAFDAAEARYNKARASIAGLRAAVVAAEANRLAAEVARDQTFIRAPFDGVILTKNANVGDHVMPFSSAQDTKGAVITLADMETLEVEADVAESNLAKIKVNQPAEIQLEAFPDERMAGVVSRMVPTVDRAKATVLVKISFVERDPRVLPDMSAKVAFLSHPVPPQDKQPVTAVRPGAIAERNGRTVVFLVSENRVRQMEVNVGRRIGELTEIQGLEPLKAGERVVLDPAEKLQNGARVRPSNK